MSWVDPHKSKLTFIPLLQLFLVEVGVLLELIQLTLGKLRLPILDLRDQPVRIVELMVNLDSELNEEMVFRIHVQETRGQETILVHCPAGKVQGAWHWIRGVALFIFELRSWREGWGLRETLAKAS